jgi:hypothetical protein
MSQTFLLQSDYDDIINYCRTSKENEKICRQRSFWINKTIQDFGISAPEFNNTTLTPSIRYLQLYTRYGGVSQGSEQFISELEIIYRAVDQRKYYLIGETPYWLNLLKAIVKKGDIAMLDRYFYLSEHKDKVKVLKSLLESAVGSGDMNVVYHILGMFPENTMIDWEDYVDSSINSGNIDMVQYVANMAHMDVTEKEYIDVAIQSGNVDMLEELSKRMELQITENDLYNSIISNNISMYQYIIDRLKQPHTKESLLAAIKHNKMNIVNYIIPKIKLTNDDWQELLHQAITYEQEPMAFYIVDAAPKGTVWNLDSIRASINDQGSVHSNTNNEAFLSDLLFHIAHKKN